MAEYDYSWDYGGDQAYDDWSWDRGGGNDAWRDFLSWGGDETQQAWYQNANLDTGNDGGTNWLSSILGAIAPLAKQFGGPAATTIGSLLNAGRGRNAVQTAGGQEADALNRGIDLQTAQWLQQQQNLAPYLQAGQGGLAQLQQLVGREQPQFQDPAAAISGANYQLPGTTPGWSPQMYQGPQGPNAGDYRWNPQAGPRAQDYRYTPGETPDAADYRWTPGQGPRAQDYRYTPGNIPSAANYRYTPGAVPTLSGKELLANDPGAQFRMEEGRKALEASAAARGGLMSGPALAALQRQGQDLASQEYGNAWKRASEQAQLREQWGQAASTMGWQQAEGEARLREQVNQIASQQGWTQAQAEAAFREGMAQQASQQGFNQAEAASRLREQVNQVASQQGWTQAQAEAAFREGQAQLASQQGWNQALAGQQNQFTQGLQGQQWNQQQQEQYATQMYNRAMEQQKLRYGMDVSQNQTDYDRANALYKQRLGAYLLPWEQQSTLANLGGQAVGMAGQQGQNATNAISRLLEQLGQTRAQSTLGQALPGQTATNTITNSLASVLSNLNR